MPRHTTQWTAWLWSFISRQSLCCFRQVTGFDWNPPQFDPDEPQHTPSFPSPSGYNDQEPVEPWTHMASWTEEECAAFLRLPKGSRLLYRASTEHVFHEYPKYDYHARWAGWDGKICDCLTGNHSRYHIIIDSFGIPPDHDPTELDKYGEGWVSYNQPTPQLVGWIHTCIRHIMGHYLAAFNDDWQTMSLSSTLRYPLKICWDKIWERNNNKTPAFTWDVDSLPIMQFWWVTPSALRLDMSRKIYGPMEADGTAPCHPVALEAVGCLGHWVAFK